MGVSQNRRNPNEFELFPRKQKTYPRPLNLMHNPCTVVLHKHWTIANRRWNGRCGAARGHDYHPAQAYGGGFRGSGQSPRRRIAKCLAGWRNVGGLMQRGGLLARNCKQQFQRGMPERLPVRRPRRFAALLTAFIAENAFAIFFAIANRSSLSAQDTAVQHTGHFIPASGSCFCALLVLPVVQSAPVHAVAPMLVALASAGTARSHIMRLVWKD